MAEKTTAPPNSRLLGRLKANARLKYWGFAFTALLTTGLYFFFQHVHLGTPRTFEWTAFDRWVSFHPLWFWVYQSLYQFIALAVFLQSERSILLRMFRGMIVVCAMACVVFFFFPVHCPRPEAVSDDFWMRLLVNLDAPTNAFPSLHVGYAVFFALSVWSATAKPSRPWQRTAWAAALLIWTLLLSYSTLATRQHYFADVWSGALLGGAVFFVLPVRGAQGGLPFARVWRGDTLFYRKLILW